MEISHGLAFKIGKRIKEENAKGLICISDIVKDEFLKDAIHDDFTCTIENGNLKITIPEVKE